MSGYPYGHGQWPPPPQPPPQQLLAQYDYRPPTNPPQIYGNGPYQTSPQIPPPQNYFGASQMSHAAFGHNASHASGLGIAADSPGQRSPNAVGGDLSWSEAFPTAAAASPAVYPPYKPPPPPQQQSYQEASNRASSSYQQPYSQQQYPSQLPPAQQRHQEQHQQKAYSVPSHPTADQRWTQVSEEGELSDDMEDAYNPEDTFVSTERVGVRTSKSPPLREAPIEAAAVFSRHQSPILPDAAVGQSAADLPSRDVSVIDTQEDEFYDEDDDQEPGEIKSTGNGISASDAADADDEDMSYSNSPERRSPAPTANQKRAASYSPELSPGEVKNGQSASPSAIAPAPTNLLNGSGSTNTVFGGVQQDVSNSSGGSGPTNTSSFASVEDAKKKAQRAILRLIPYGVNYQTYIDEGFDGKLIKTMFSELGLRASPVEVTETPKDIAEAQTTPAPVQDAPPPASNETAPKKEERKDKIARLLALKASKPAPAIAPLPATLPPKPPKPETTKSEKGRLLQQKLEALRQAQELRASAAAKAVVEATALSETVPNGQESKVAAAIVDQMVDKSAAISASLPLSVPPVPSLPAISSEMNSRKRPVAADFVDSSSPTAPNPLKRPFSLARQESSLVIDISGDSGDDDVEMEVDSQPDESTLAQQNHPSAYRDQPGNSFPGRSAGSAMPVPPTAPASMIGRIKDDEYTRKMRQIEDMKRKIAEAEAKKGRSTSTGSLTPQTGGHGTPPENSSHSLETSLVVRPPPQSFRRISSTGELSMNGEVAHSEAATPISLPKRPADVRSPSSSHDSHRGKRFRAASLQLPRVEAGLQEKMFKLRLLQDKVARLQAEIDDGIAEKRRLTEDIDDLTSSGSDAPSEPEPQPRATSVIVIDEDVAESPAVEEVEEEAALNASVAPVLDSGVVDNDVQAGDQSSLAKPSEVVPEAEVGIETGSKVSQASGEAAAESIDMSNSSPSEPLADAVDEYGDIQMDEVEEGEVEEVEGEEERKNCNAEVEPGEEDAAGSALGIDDNETSAQAPVEVQQLSTGTEVVVASKPVSKATAATTMSTYTPYESPLHYFRSYRYHPEYKAHVAGGLKSLTYSGKIQEDTELCPNELDGQSCPDPACSFQHYASIVPQDDQILVELGRSDDYTGEQKARFVDGLKAVLKRVRDDKVRDFDTIADAIIDFRRKFLGDDSRVLAHLEGTTV